MSSIAGIFTKQNRNIRERVLSMLNSMKHRGPDGINYHHKDNIAIGNGLLKTDKFNHTQLPLSTADEMMWITFDGAIYNRLELKQELSNKGYQFKENCDAEIVLNGYKEWKEKVLNKLRGMFAFCIVDHNNGNLFLARDHFGIKPLFYRIEKDTFSFASELNALRKEEFEKPKGETKALFNYIKFGVIPAPLTIYKHLFKLKPANYIIYNINNQNYKESCYYRLNFNPLSIKSKDWVEYSCNIIEDSVKQQIQTLNNKTIGVFFSGGIDSTLIALFAAKFNNNVEAFTIGCNEEDYSEFKYAEEAARKIGIKLNYDVFEKKELSTLPFLIAERYGEPIEDGSILPTWFAGTKTCDKTNIVLTGDGADNLFGGLSSQVRYINDTVINVVTKKIKAKQHSSIPRFLVGSLNKYLKNGCNANDINFWNRIVTKNNQYLIDLVKNEYKHYFFELLPEMKNIHYYSKKYDKMCYTQAMTLGITLSPRTLNKEDISTAGHSMEFRTPFLDVKVAELACSLPHKMKVNNLYGKEVYKYVLKKVISESFDKDFILRKSQGLIFPRNQWIEDNQVLKMYKDYIYDKKTNMQRFFNMNQVDNLFQNMSGNNDNKNAIWQLFILATWLNKNSNIEFE